MSNINVDILLQTDNEKDELFTQLRYLLSALQKIRERKSGIVGEINLPTLREVECSHKVYITKRYMPYVPIAFIYTKAQRHGGSSSFGNTIRFGIEQSGNFIGDTFLHIKLSSAFTNDISLPATSAKDTIRYSTLPAVKLINRTKLMFNGTQASEVTRFNYIHYLNHELPRDKLDSYYKMLGNEDLLNCSTVPNPGYSDYRIVTKVGYGPQTPKVTQDALELFYPLIFWYSTTSDKSLVNRVIDRISVDVELAGINDILEKLPTGTDGTVTYPTIDTIDLYYKDVFVSRELHEIYVKTKKFEVVSTWREQHFPIDKSNDTMLLNARNWPIERLYLSYIPDTTYANFDHWYKSKVLTSKTIPIVTSFDTVSGIPLYTIDTIPTDVLVESNPIIKLDVRTHSITYFNEFPGEFFSKYDTDFNEKIYRQEDGSFIINFDYKPGEKNMVSGYSSTSNNTNFNLKYWSDYFNSLSTGTLYISAKVLDALLVDTYLLELRYNV